MTDSTTFETRLTDALGRYADRVKTDVDPVVVTRSIAAPSRTSVAPPRFLVLGRHRLLPILVVLAIGASIAGIAVLGDRSPSPAPSVVASPTASASSDTHSASPAATPGQTFPAALPWVAEAVPGANELVGIFGLWRVSDRFIGVAHGTEDPRIPTAFIVSDDGRTWRSAPSPAAGLQVEAGVVEDGVLWIVGDLGSPDDPKRGIWTTGDGATWERRKGVSGLDFGMGRVTALSHATAGWVALAQHALDPEDVREELYRSPDGTKWVKVKTDALDGLANVRGLVSDGRRWLMVGNDLYPSGQVTVIPSDAWAITSVDGLDWTRTPMAALRRYGSISALAYGAGGFVAVGQDMDTEFPLPTAWRSPDGVKWTKAVTVGLPGLAGETGLNIVIAYDGGFLASGYRLHAPPTFWKSIDGSTWTQTDDSVGLVDDDVQALAASDDRFIAGGQWAGAPFLWSTPH